jgi:glycine/D-amino acid oxidase-like deaminating enzyme
MNNKHTDGKHSMNDVMWNDEGWIACESLQRSIACDVCVVGLGGSGLAAIELLAAHGVDVIGIDAGMIGGGAAGSNGGFILAGIAAFHHDAVAALGASTATALYQETIEEIAYLAHHEPLFRQVGSLRIATDATEFADCMEQYRRMRQDGLAVEWYEGSEGKGLLFPLDGAFQPLKRVRRIANHLRSAGVRLYERTRVTSIMSGQLCANGHTIGCNQILVAVDGQLERILPVLKQQVRTTRLQMLGTAPDHTITLPRPVYARYGYDYWQQLPDGRLVVGGSRDKFETSEWGFDTVPTPDVQMSIETILRSMVGSNAAITHRWGASVSYRTDDIRPLINQIAPGVWVCGAYNGTGNIVGSICAKHVARAMITGSTTHMQAWGAGL